jgi:methylthioribose-1-phosphate isomerase
VIEIRRMRKRGAPLAEIAKEYGVTIGMVSHIATGRRWRYLVGAEDNPAA